ncbi:MULTISPECIES: TetR/AcrR family transcriptional regulator [unclassified Chelatococcus]|uniref:TetR/AcrR family transcriptional regulator n=1 Tax=unclassified Chelatococcus TaxID=2638111 RepID=UPI001BCCF5D8|nr:MULTISPECIES: TetR/AcrR family transcriptional regulator [unclassified Chelatococcus]MBS7699967.1 TetR/AcrR family transcriptional regulator [Chelatococcus sp. YT9]MBX3558608.1 TetR/AcrR family transcriptional regulator [Chelatococcus sp.]
MMRSDNQDGIEGTRERERLGQKLRTRRDLLAAARALIDRGAEVNLAAVADEAGISRATAYRYFSDAAALALEAVLDGIVSVPENIIPEGSPVRDRVHAVRRYWLAFCRTSENRLRIFAARAMESGAEGAPRYQRYARRLPMFIEALSPVSATLGEKRTNELALLLAATSGFENYITMKDILRLNEEQIETYSETILDALLEKYGVS